MLLTSLQLSNYTFASKTNICDLKLMLVKSGGQKDSNEKWNDMAGNDAGQAAALSEGYSREEMTTCMGSAFFLMLKRATSVGDRNKVQ